MSFFKPSPKKSGILDVIRFDPSGDTVGPNSSDKYIVQKWMPKDSAGQYITDYAKINLGSQLKVNFGQEAIFVKGGQALDVFTEGTHTLISGNLPLLDKLVNLPFGNNTPFSAEVWFINLTVKRNMRWGTSGRIPLYDPQLGIAIEVGAYGQWGFRISDSRSFVTQIVGAQQMTDSVKIEEYFIGEIVEKASQTISEFITDNNLSILQINAKRKEISEITQNAIIEEFDRFGIELINFSISNISIPEKDMAVLKSATNEKMRINQLSSANVGQGYIAARSFDVMEDAAQNTGTAGNIMGMSAAAGMGFGMALPMGQQMGLNAANSMQSAPAMQQQAATTPVGDDITIRLSKIKTMLDSGIITQEEYNMKRSEIIAEL